MLQEEEYWALKSRLNWASFGDRNTSFFHVSTVVRRNRNKIRCIKDKNGEWIMEEKGVKEFILTGYKKLFSTELNYSTLSSEVSHFCSCFLTEEEKNRLSQQISEEEIRAGLWALKAFKGPRPDSLHAGFFQYFWHDVKESVCMEIKRIFASGSMPDYLNRTLILLIPKCQHLETFGSYRPISLCNSVYKIVTKIVVGRIRPLLNKLVSPVQTAFVLGRRGLDNIIIAQKLIHSIDNKRGKEGYMAIKVDLA